jgi:hypothetical protein
MKLFIAVAGVLAGLAWAGEGDFCSKGVSKQEAQMAINKLSQLMGSY